MKKRTLIMLAAAGFVALGGGTAAAMADEGTTSPGEKPAAASTEEKPAANALTVDQAIAKAQEAAGGTVESADLEHGSVWEVELLTDTGEQREVRVDAAGKVTQDDGSHDKGDKRDKGEDSEDAAEAAALKAAKVTAAQAAATATGSVSGTVTSVELEDEHGQAAWEVEIRDGNGAEHKVFVDAANGKVTKTVADHDDDHGDRHGDHESEDGNDD